MKKNDFLAIIIILTFNTQNFTIIRLMEAPLSGDLNGLGFTFAELQKLRDRTLEKQIENQINSLKNKQPLTPKDDNRLDELQNEYKIIKNAAEKMLWHLKTPTTGIHFERNYHPTADSYIPHFFNLWDLAPNQGAGIKVASIDTGVAAFSLLGDTSLRKHRDLEMPVILQNNYNIISQEGLNPIKQLVQVLKPYLNINNLLYKESDLEKLIPQWIIEYKQKGTTKALWHYLKKIGKKEHIDKAIKEFTTGDYGIKTRENYFTINQLVDRHQNPFVIQNLLPLAPIAPTKKLSSFLSHGSHTFGLIGARLDGDTPASEKGIVGIAPQADVFMIKAFGGKAMESDKATLMAAIKKSLDYGAQVVNLSLKISDQLDMFSKSTKTFQALIDKIPYAVAASGNNGDPRFPHYSGHVLGYPARFVSVPFTVGAYGIKEGQPFIPDFSQYEKNVGPTFVAPGIDILSAGLLPNQKVNSAYLFLDGTSMACSIMSGFIALMLGEFQNDFSREQLIAACYSSGVKLAKNTQWKERTLLGVLDMPTTLFMLHVLKSIKDKNLVDDFDKQFNRLLAGVRTLIIGPINQFDKTILDKKEALQLAVNHFVSIIQYLLNKDTKKIPYSPLGFYDDQILIDVEFILKDPSYKFSFVDNKKIEENLIKKIKHNP